MTDVLKENNIQKIVVTTNDYVEFKNLDKTKRKDFIQNLITHNKQTSIEVPTSKDILSASLIPFNTNSEIYIASMLLKFAVIDNNLEISKLLLSDYKADPRIFDHNNRQSALTCALAKGDLNFVKIFKRNLNPAFKKQSIEEDFRTISSIYGSNLYDYEPDDLLDMLCQLYTDIDDFFNF